MITLGGSPFINQRVLVVFRRAWLVSTGQPLPSHCPILAASGFSGLAKQTAELLRDGSNRSTSVIWAVTLSATTTCLAWAGAAGNLQQDIRNTVF